MLTLFTIREHGGARAVAWLLAACSGLSAQDPLTWEQARDRMIRNNLTLATSRTNIEESRANEVTAGLRPNPQLSFIADQFRVFKPNPLQPFQNAQLTPYLSQHWERRGKRELRVESAQFATAILKTDAADLERQLTYSLRDAFNRTLQAKSVLEVANENLAHYDRVIAVNRERFQAGDISRADMDRVELQRVQFESDLVNAQVSLRTAKIDLLALMNDHTPVDSFDVTGPFDFNEKILLRDELHQAALEARPDVRSATTAIDKAKTDHKLAIANGSWDPDLGIEYQRTQADNTLGIGLAIPVRIFDRNQGEKARTALEVRRTEQSRAALSNIVFHDVDAAYEQLDNVRKLLRPYRDRYLPQASRVRDTVSFAYQRGGASLLEFLDAQKSYRDLQLQYRTLIGSFLTAENQLNLAVGREVME